MALFKVTLFKRLNSVSEERPWTNTYHVDATSVEDALDHAESIVEVERLVTWSVVEFYRVSAKQVLEDGPAGQARTISELGTRDATGENWLPLFNGVRVVLDDLAARPDQKYLRPPVMESECNNGALVNDTVDLINTAYVGGLLALPYLRSSSNGSYIGGRCEPFIQMRQRGWKRRSREGFKRGWVPDTE